ncbi:MAG TPA: response regulator [Anaerolineales bacterium]|nr:response regulator [Anaerolineales bacterium]
MTKLRLLLADNNNDYRESLRQLLEMEGFLVTAVDSVPGAFEKLETMNWDLVLVDLRLSNDNDHQDTSGCAVVINADQREIPCIVITAFPTVDAARLTLRSLTPNATAVDFVPKAQGPEAVLKSIRSVFGITLLHISDLHPKVPASGEVPYDQEEAYSQFLGDVLNQPGLGLNPLRTVLVSGDISYRNQDESFEWAKHYLIDLSDKLCIPKHQFIMTPGNHDINRLNAQQTADSLHSMTTNNVTWFSKYDKYLNFTQHFYGEPAFTPERLYRLFTFDNQVAIVAFNSCLVEGDSKWKCSVCAATTGKEHYCGWIDRHQVLQASIELNAMKWPGLRIGMFHHHVVSEDYDPPHDSCQGDHLWPYHDTEHWLKFILSGEGFHILLHGHRHKTELKQPQTIGSDAPINLGSGAFWPVNNDKQETANYLLLQFSPMAEKSRVIMRKYFPTSENRRGYWGADNSIRPDGLIRLPGIRVPTAHAD